MVRVMVLYNGFPEWFYVMVRVMVLDNGFRNGLGNSLGRSLLRINR